MPKFKLLGIFIFIATAFLGCIARDVPSKVEGCRNAAFIVDEVTGTLAISDETALPEKFTLDLRARIRSRGKIETTLPNIHWAVSNNKKELDKDPKDIAKSTNLDNKTNKAIQMTADGTGTIEWTVEHDYAYSKKSKWIVLDLYIKGLSNEYPGLCHIPLAVNPWLQLRNYADIQVADYREQYNKKNNRLKGRVDLKGQSFLDRKKREEKDKGVDLVMYNLDLKWGGEKTANYVKNFSSNTISAQLQYSIEDVHGGLKENTIKHGDFDIESHLLMFVSNKSRQEAKAEAEAEAEAEGKKKTQYVAQYVKINENNPLVGTQFQESGNRLTSMPFDWVVRFASTNGDTPFLLYIKIIPKGNTAGRLNVFEGIYFLGRDYRDTFTGTRKVLSLHPLLGQQYFHKMRSGNGTQFADSSISGSIQLDDFDNCLKNIHYGKDSIMKFCVSSEQIHAGTDGVRKLSWTVRPMNIRFFNMVRENWLSREISTNIDTVVVDSKGNPVSAKEIKVKVTDLSTGEETEHNIHTENNGSIVFTINTRQQWYKKQRFFLKLIQFKTAGSEELLEEKIIAINPWDYGFTHGYEVHKADGIRTACLKKDNKMEIPIESGGTGESQTPEKSSEDEMSRLIYSPLEKDAKKLSEGQKKVIHNFFCYNETGGKSGADSGESEKFSKKLFNIFNLFKKTFQELTSHDPEQEISDQDKLNKFQKKFKLLAKVPRPASYVHLFRAINKYPYYLIDDSLNRSLYYDTRLKITPRVVRYDEINRGQQNKGPLRDGVYIFQMALLKNDQGRFFGARNMVRRESTEFYLSSNLLNAGTVSLFTCPLDKPECITKEDFIIPPTNIPIVVFDGMIKEDIQLPIRRKHLLFANSKNFFVFRILPADPETVICQDGTSKCAKYFDGEWNKNIDWELTKKSVRPADLKSYDMIFHTYRVPFIPSIWSNWAITKEMKIDFNNLEDSYNATLSDLEKARVESGASETVEAQKAELDCKNTAVVNFDMKEQLRQAELALYNAQERQTEPGGRFSSPELIKKYEQAVEERRGEWNRQLAVIDSTLKCSGGEGGRPEIEDVLVTASQYEQIKDFCKDYLIKTACADSSLKEEDKLQYLLNIAGQGTPGGKEKTSADFCNFVSAPEQYQLSEFAIKECQSRVQPSSMSRVKKGGQVVAPQVNPGDFQEGEDSCVEARQGADSLSDKRCSRPETQDRLNTHIEYFSSANSLCTLGIDSEKGSELLPGHCGAESAPVTQDSFLRAVNEQIQTLHKVREKAREISRQRQNSRQGTMRGVFDKETGKALQEEAHSLNESLNQNQAGSKAYSHKVQNSSDLDLTLKAEDLERIIRMDNIMAGNTDPKTFAFLHALCGFWFERFLSQEYINPQLISASFRNAVKSTVYYKMRGMAPLPGEEGECAGLSEETDFKENTNINCLLRNMEDRYKEELSERELFGNIDNLHKWAGDKWTKEERKSAKNIEYEKYISQRLTEKASTPPLRSDARPASWDQNADSSVEAYLNEAVAALQGSHYIAFIRRKNEDYHPVRKCVNNPSHFFGFEKKVIVGKISEKSQYGDKGGQRITISVNEDFLMNSQRDTGANQQFGTTLDTKLSLLTLPLLALGGVGYLAGRWMAPGIINSIKSFFMNIRKRSVERIKSGARPSIFSGSQIVPLAVMAFIGWQGVSGAADYSYRAYDGSGRRKLLSIRVSEGVNLIAEHIPVDIALANHRECLLVRPRLSAFQSPAEEGDRYDHIWSDKNKTAVFMYEKMGLLLCAKSARKTLKEEYYYIYPDYPVNGLTMDPSSHRNKPFTVSIRGKKEYRKFVRNLNCHVAETTYEEKSGLDCRDLRGEYEYLAGKHLEFAENLRQGFNLPKMFHQTADSPGVYSIYEGKDRDHTDQSKLGDFESLYYRFMRWGGWLLSADLEQYFKRDPAQRE